MKIINKIKNYKDKKDWKMNEIQRLNGMVRVMDAQVTFQRQRVDDVHKAVDATLCGFVERGILTEKEAFRFARDFSVNLSSYDCRDLRY